MCKYDRIRCLLTLGAALVLTGSQAPAHAFMQDYTPLKTGDLKRKFKLQAVAASEALKQGKELHVAGCQLKVILN